MSAALHRIPSGPVLTTLVLLIGLLPSCGRPDPARLAEVDRLLGTCDSLGTVVNGIDADAYRRMDSIFGTQRAWFDERFRDTLDTASARILGNYHRAMNGPLQELLEAHTTLMAGIDSSSTRLGRLKHDLSQALLEEGAATAALQAEHDHLQQWRTNADVLLQGLPVIDATWDQYHAAVDSMITPTDTIADRP